MLQEQDDAVSDQVDGRLEARADEQGRVRREFVVGHRAVGGQPAERIVARLTGTQFMEARTKFAISASQAVDSACAREGRRRPSLAVRPDWLPPCRRSG